MKTDLTLNSQPEALVFDFDGVIADTEPLYWRSWCEILTPLGIAFEWEDYCRIGRGIRDEKMLESLAELTADPQLAFRIGPRVAERGEKIRGWLSQSSPISQSTVQLLKSLHGHSLGLVTSSNRVDVQPLLDGAGIAGCFKSCVFGEEMSSHKPDPAPYLLIRRKLGIGGVAFEDSDAGMQSAKGAGFEVIRVTVPENLPGLVESALRKI